MATSNLLAPFAAALALSIAAPVAAQRQDGDQERQDGDQGFLSGELGAGDTDRRAAVVWQVEQTLAKRGFPPGVVDGRFTERTKQALQRYQRANDLLADGELSDRTLRSLGVSPGYGGAAGFDVGPFGASGEVSAGRSGLASSSRIGAGPLETGVRGYVGPFGAGGDVDFTVAGVGVGAQAEASVYQIGGALNFYTRDDEPQQLGLAINPPFVGRNGTGIDVSIPFLGTQGVGLGQDPERGSEQQAAAEPESGLANARNEQAAYAGSR